MNIQLTSRNLDITDALRDHVNKKFKKLEKMSDRITKINVILDIDKLNQTAEANIHIPGAEINASATSDDMYNSIGMLVDKLITQIKKHKDKHSN